MNQRFSILNQLVVIGACLCSSSGCMHPSRLVYQYETIPSVGGNSPSPVAAPENHSFVTRRVESLAPDKPQRHRRVDLLQQPQVTGIGNPSANRPADDGFGSSEGGISAGGLSQGPTGHCCTECSVCRTHDVPPERGHTRLTPSVYLDSASTQPLTPAASGFQEWQPHCRHCQLNLRDDLCSMWPRLWEDARGVANVHNGLILGAALGGALIMRHDLDDEVRERTRRRPERWGEFTNVLSTSGEAPVQWPAVLGLYGYSLYSQNSELHDLSQTLLSALSVSGVTTVLLKGIANTDRPSGNSNNGQFGFPSYHTASSFALAGVLDSYYGPKVGLPAYTVSGMIGWARMDELNHDLSDVVYGAALGYVIGKSIANRHLTGDSRVRLLPYVHPTDGSSGLMLELPY